MLVKKVYIALTTLALASVLSGSAQAQSLESYIPGGFEITARVNAHQFFNAPLLEPIRLAHKAKIDNAANGLQMITGVNIRQDIDSIAVAGYLDDNRKNDAIILIKGKWDATRLINMVKMNPKYEEIKTEGATIYGFWADDQQAMRYGAFPAADVLVLGGRPGVEAVVKSVASKQSIMSSPIYKAMFDGISDEALVRIVALQPARIPADKPGMEIVRALKAASFVLDVSNGFDETLTLEAQDQEAAVHFQNIMKGVISLGKLVKENPDVTQIANKLELTSEGTTLILSLNATQAEVNKFVDDHPVLKRLMTPTE